MAEESSSESIQDSIKEAISERVKNPLLGSFAISWLIVNWQFVAILIRREGPIEETIKVLKSGYSDPFNLLWLPLLLASCVVLFYPWLTLGIMIFRTMPHMLLERRKIDEEIRLARLRLRLSEFRTLEGLDLRDLDERRRLMKDVELDYEKAKKA